MWTFAFAAAVLLSSCSTSPSYGSLEPRDGFGGLSLQPDVGDVVWFGMIVLESQDLAPVEILEVRVVDGINLNEVAVGRVLVADESSGYSWAAGGTGFPPDVGMELHEISGFVWSPDPNAAMLEDVTGLEIFVELLPANRAEFVSAEVFEIDYRHETDSAIETITVDNRTMLI